MKDVIIYKAVNKINNKFYIGVTTQTLKRRRKAHERLVDKTAFHCAIQKYGKENFEWYIIHKFKTDSRQEINEIEIAFISKYDAFESRMGYNLTMGGDGNLFPSQETLDKLSKAHLGSKRTKEQRKKISDSRIGMKFSDEHKKNLSIARKKRITTDETKKRISDSNKGKINIKRYLVVDPTGKEYITTNGLADFCEKNDLTRPNLLRTLTDRLHHKGWKILKRMDDNND